MAFIDQPNIRGVGCNFKGRGNGALTQPYTNLMVPPNMPNYGLGALAGSPCDTLHPPKDSIHSIRIYPNPATDYIQIALPYGSGRIQWVVYDIIGQVLLKQEETWVQSGVIQIPIKGLPRALYTLKVKTEKEEYVGKFLKE